VAEAAQRPALDDRTDREVLAGVRTVPADLVGLLPRPHHDPLVGVPPGLVRLDGRQGRFVGVLEQTDQVVVVPVRLAPRGQAQRQQQVLPGDLAVQHRAEPVPGKGERVLRRGRAAVEVDPQPVGVHPDVPGAAVRPGDLEPDRHPDPRQEVRRERAQPGDVPAEPVPEVRPGCARRRVYPGERAGPVGRVPVEVPVDAVGVAEPGGDRVGGDRAGGEVDPVAGAEARPRLTGQMFAEPFDGLFTVREDTGRPQ